MFAYVSPLKSADAYFFLRGSELHPVASSVQHCAVHSVGGPLIVDLKIGRAKVA